MRIGALEAGGTKMVCAVGDETGALFERAVFPTTVPEETLPPMIEWFSTRGIDTIGIGCFGPVELDPASPRWGFITTTPKPGWADCNIAGSFGRALCVPVGFDTDVNASVLGEVTYGAAAGLSTVLYLTVGTGIGLGVYCNGRLHHGISHPEGGHLIVQRHPKDTYGGHCPFHPDCLEGFASGPAIAARWGADAQTLTQRREVWEMEAYYLAQALTDYIYVLAPERIILGGGVMKQKELFPLLRSEVSRRLNGYLSAAAVRDLSRYIVPESLAGDQGILGCLRLGELAAGPEKE